MATTDRTGPHPAPDRRCSRPRCARNGWLARSQPSLKCKRSGGWFTNMCSMNRKRTRKRLQREWAHLYGYQRQHQRPEGRSNPQAQRGPQGRHGHQGQRRPHRLERQDRCSQQQRDRPVQHAPDHLQRQDHGQPCHVCRRRRVQGPRDPGSADRRARRPGPGRSEPRGPRQPGLDGQGTGHQVPTRASVERELKRYERRGATARNRFERQVRRTRTRFERELRQRRNRVEKTVKQNRRRFEREVRSVRKDIEKQSGTLAARVEKLVSDAGPYRSVS